MTGIVGYKRLFSDVLSDFRCVPGSRRSIHNVRFPKKSRQLQVQVTVPASAGPSIRLRQQSTTDQRVNHVTTQLPKGKPGSGSRERPANTQHSVSRNSKKRPFWPKISRAGPLVRAPPPGGLPNSVLPLTSKPNGYAAPKPTRLIGEVLGKLWSRICYLLKSMASPTGSEPVLTP